MRFAYNKPWCIIPKTVHRSRPFIQCYHLGNVLYYLCSPSKCKFGIVRFKLIFNWRTQQIQKLPQIKTLDEQLTELIDFGTHNVYSPIIIVSVFNLKQIFNVAGFDNAVDWYNCCCYYYCI